MNNKETIDRLNGMQSRCDNGYDAEAIYLAIKALEDRPTGHWIVTAEDTEGVHRIQCPFCGYEKGSDFVDYITVTFERMPTFCENCGARLEAENEQ